MSRRTSALFTSSDQMTSNRPSSSTASGASRNSEPYVVPIATATSIVLASTTSPSSTSLASWHWKSLSNLPTDHRYRPVPPRYVGASATPAATSASKPIPRPLLNGTPLTSAVSTTRTLSTTSTSSA